MFTFIFNWEHHFLNTQQEDNIFDIMGQFLDYMASVFFCKAATTIPEGKEKSSTNSIGFLENSFTQTFAKFNDNEAKSALIASLSNSNKKTINIFSFIGASVFLLHLFIVTVPKMKSESFSILQSEMWQLVTLNLVPLVVYFSSIRAMNEINQPIPEGTKLTEKNSGLDLNNNDFVTSLKIVIFLMALCQISSLLSNDLLWTVMMIVPFWCYQMTSRMAKSEYERYAPVPKKQWVKLNLPKSPPKASTPPKQKNPPSAKKVNAEVKATPRTRTRRAFKNMIDTVEDKYHIIQQNVAHQISQKIMNPNSPRMKMIEN